jgi:O-antigen/teichoic acid export membrane protein
MRVAASGFLRSPALRISGGYASAGVAWVGANLAMARLLPPQAFGYLTLAIAIVQTAGPLAPLGADGLARRGTLEFGRATWSRSLTTCLLVGAIAAVAGRGIYALPWVAAAAIFVGTAASGMAAMAAAQLQATQRFAAALLINQAHLVALTVAAIFVLLAHEQRASLPALVFGVVYLMVAMVGWRVALVPQRQAASAVNPFRWRDASSMLLIQSADSLLYQMDRLLIPRLLSVLELGVYGVITSVAASPFRTLQMGVVYTLMPRLRNAADPATRRRLLLEEGKRLVIVTVGGGAAILLLTRPLLHLVLAGKYEVNQDLVVAMVVVGIARVCDGFGTAVGIAAAENHHLRMLSLCSWAAVTVGAIASVAGAHWGLTGFVYGLAAGWLTRAALTAWYGASIWRRRAR